MGKLWSVRRHNSSRLGRIEETLERITGLRGRRGFSISDDGTPLFTRNLRIYRWESCA
jgi:hypothetical protein